MMNCNNCYFNGTSIYKSPCCSCMDYYLWQPVDWDEERDFFD